MGFVDLAWQRLRDGGWGMVPILWCLVLAVTVAIERAIQLASIRTGTDALFDRVGQCLRAGEDDLAARLCERDASPIARVLRAAVLYARRPRARIESAVGTAALLEVPRVRGATRHLATIAQIAMLLGLLGTLSGLMDGLRHRGGGPSIDPGAVGAAIARALGESMNCTAFGLLTALVALSAYAVLDARTRALVVALDEASVRAIRIVADAALGDDA